MHENFDGRCSPIQSKDTTSTGFKTYRISHPYNYLYGTNTCIHIIQTDYLGEGTRICLNPGPEKPFSINFHLIIVNPQIPQKKKVYAGTSLSWRHETYHNTSKILISTVSSKGTTTNYTQDYGHRSKRTKLTMTLLIFFNGSVTMREKKGAMTVPRDKLK